MRSGCFRPPRAIGPVVVNLQNGEARTRDELEILVRDCVPDGGERALVSPLRRLDEMDPEIRRQHRAAQALGEPSEDDRRRMEESLRVLERTTPSVYD